MKPFTFLLLVFLITNSYAAKYDTCMKWTLGAIGVHCKSDLKKDIGTILLFKKISENEWQYISSHNEYPFDIILDGPGLNGPTVTKNGYRACDEFCEKYVA